MNDPEGKKTTIRRYLGLDPTLKVASSRVLTFPSPPFLKMYTRVELIYSYKPSSLFTAAGKVLQVKPRTG
jgi:hypothetical protein